MGCPPVKALRGAQPRLLRVVLPAAWWRKRHHEADYVCLCRRALCTIVTPENFEAFSGDPRGFLRQVTGPATL